MEYTTLGDTGTTVSRICLGCTSFGSSDWRDWVLDEEAGLELVDRAIESGIDFFSPPEASIRTQARKTSSRM
jgi:aryl-alcohol dehydrogenase-like predicted oxidoreductase